MWKATGILDGSGSCGCAKIDKVYVATDSEKIRETLLEVKQQEENEAFQKLEVIGRSAESASDTASTEFAMLEFANEHAFDHIVLIQATSPLLTAEDLDRDLHYMKKRTPTVCSLWYGRNGLTGMWQKMERHRH